MMQILSIREHVRIVLALRALKPFQDTAKENAETRMLLIAFAIYYFLVLLCHYTCVSHM